MVEKKSKLRCSLFYDNFSQTLEEVIEVFTSGAKKHGDDSWKRLVDGEKEYMNAADRHRLKIGKGILKDVDSGKRHIIHQIADLFIVSELQRRRIDEK